MIRPLLLAALPAYCLAAHVRAEEVPAPKPEILERDPEGNATKAKVDGQIYDVCSGGRTDGCVNAREIGLDQGRPAINYWPGRPASEIEGPLPVGDPKAPKPAPGPG